MNLTLATCNQTALDVPSNVDRIIAILELSRKAGSQLVCLPELAVSGYGCEDGFYSQNLLEKTQRGVERILTYTHSIGVFLGVPLYHKGSLYNALIFAVNGQIKGINFKKTLTNSGIHYESRWFSPWPHGTCDYIHYAEQENIICGDLFYKVAGVGVGVEICEESWSRKRSLTSVAHECEIVINASASYFALGKHKLRQQLIADSSRLLEAHVLYSNMLGVDSGRIIYDGALMWAFEGQIQAQAPRMSLKEISLAHLTLDLNASRSTKLRQSTDTQLPQPGSHSLESPRCVEISQEEWHSSPSPSQASPPTEDLSCSTTTFSSHTGQTHPPAWSLPLDQRTTLKAEEEYFMALTLALFDYLRKAKAKGYVVSISGGRDSALTLILASAMIRRGLTELGIQGFLKSLKHLNLQDVACQQGKDLGSHSEKNTKWIISQLITGVYQPSPNSSQESAQISQELCSELGAFYCEYDISQVMDHYLKGAEQSLERSFTWSEDSLLLQNIQARCRSPFPWLLANAKGAVLLSTGNRSEASLGYMTMDGDTCGGLAPLGGTSKYFLIQWLKWAHKEGCGYLSERGSIQALDQVLAREPTAELCPPQWEQSDEKDLMPYEVISQLEKLRIYDKKDPAEVHKVLIREFPSISAEMLKEYQERFDFMWQKSQWKRERLALSFHVDEVNVDPKSGCRYPVLSGALSPKTDPL